MLYCVTLFIISLSFIHHIIYIFHTSFFHTKEQYAQEYHSYISIKKHQFQFISKILKPKNMFKLVNNNTTLNLNIVSYFLNILASPDELTWNTIGGPITKATNHIGLTKHHRRTVEITWHMVHRKNITKYFGQRNLLIILYELNILSDAMENHLGLRYTTHLINCHRHREYFNAVCNCTVDLEFLRLQPKITKCRIFNKVWRMRVSRKKHDCAKRNNGWLSSTVF